MRINNRFKRKGTVVVLTAILLPALVGLGAFAIDLGYITYMRSQLQAGADAGALAAVDELPSDQTTLDALAVRYATFNSLANGTLQVTVEGGTWDEDAGVFTAANLSDANAVKVTVVSQDSGLFLGPLLGKSLLDITASAICVKPGGGIGTRFLIDDEMIDTDVPSIEQLADDENMDVEEMLTARGFNQGKYYGAGDWTWVDSFLDIPAGATLTLPTGQGTSYDNNDAGMFDIDHPSFPFTDDTSFMEFLMYSETGNDSSKWGTDSNNILQQLDPLEGVSPVTDDSTYASFVDPDFIHVSPVFFSDVSTLNMQGGVPQVNAKGLRRGLIAFKIIAVGNDPDGGGSDLPELVIEIVDPSTINPGDIELGSGSQGGGNGKAQLVQ